jgi:hypothetical protein
VTPAQIDAMLERMDVLCENTHGLLGQMEKRWKKVGSPGWANRGFRAPAIGPAGDVTNRSGTQKIGEWTEEFTCEEGDPSLAVSMAVSLSDQNIAELLAAGANLDFSDAFMQISFGTSNRGPESIVNIDLISGTAFSMIGNRATFWLVYPKSTAQNAQSPLLDISVSIGVGTGGGVGNTPRKTQKVPDLIQNQESVKVAIPPFAHLAMLQAKDATVQAIIKQYGSGGAAVLSQTPIGQTPNTSVPVANGARFFTLTNTAAGTTGPAVVFLLNMA